MAIERSTIFALLIGYGRYGTKSRGRWLDHLGRGGPSPSSTTGPDLPVTFSRGRSLSHMHLHSVSLGLCGPGLHPEWLRSLDIGEHAPNKATELGF